MKQFANPAAVFKSQNPSVKISYKLVKADPSYAAEVQKANEDYKASVAVFEDAYTTWKAKNPVEAEEHEAKQNEMRNKRANRSMVQKRGGDDAESTATPNTCDGAFMKLCSENTSDQMVDLRELIDTHTYSQSNLAQQVDTIKIECEMNMAKLADLLTRMKHEKVVNEKLMKSVDTIAHCMLANMKMNKAENGDDDDDDIFSD